MSEIFPAFCDRHPAGTLQPCRACGQARRLQEAALASVHSAEILDRSRTIISHLGEAVRDRLTQPEMEDLVARLVNPEPAPAPGILEAARGEIGVELRAIPLERPLIIKVDGDAVVVELGSHAGQPTALAAYEAGAR